MVLLGWVPAFAGLTMVKEIEQCRTPAQLQPGPEK